MTDDLLSLLAQRIEQSFGRSIDELRQDGSATPHADSAQDLIVRWYDQLAYTTEVLARHRTAHLEHVAADDAVGMRASADALATAIRSRDARAQTLSHLIKRHSTAPDAAAPDPEVPQRAAAATTRAAFPVLRPLPPRRAVTPSPVHSR